MDEPEYNDGILSEPAQDPTAYIAYAVAAQNIAEDLADDDLANISQRVISDHRIDSESMSDWRDRMERGVKLATMQKDHKTFPYDGAANIRFPLITSAALQFNARAYPAVVPADRPVKARVWGDDPSGAKAARAARISEHMSHQLLNDVSEWEEDTDKLLTLLPIVGTVVRKWWYDSAQGRARCRLIEPGRFIVNDKVRSLHDAPRVTEELSLYPSEIQERIAGGLFVDFEWSSEGDDKDAPQEFIEQHTRLDLDEDGYAEPYVVTVHVDTQKVVRIVADFSEADVRYSFEPVSLLDDFGNVVTQEVPSGILSIKRGSYFVAFHFLPSLDGGFFGTGLGLLLGDISETIDSILNMMMDAGAHQSLGGGFLGSEFRVKGGASRFRPGEWKTATASGADIRNGIVPLTYPGASPTLFQLLGLLIDAGREISSIKDVVTGDAPQRQQTATATLALIEQGLSVFTAAYKRIHLGLRNEYGLLARINAQTVDSQEYAAFHDGDVDAAADYNVRDLDVQPVSDPRSVTKMQQAAKAQFLMQLADAGMIDRGEAMARIAEAMDIEDVEDLAPKPDPMQQQAAMMQMQAAQADLAQKTAGIQLTLAQIEKARADAVSSLAKVEDDANRTEIAAYEAKLSAITAGLEDERKRIETLLRSFGGMAGKPGDAGNAQSVRIYDLQAPGGYQQPILGGSAGFGGGPEGASDFGAMDRGLF